MTLDDFLPYVLPRAKGCANPIAAQAVRLALIELCEKALVWREFQTSQNTVANQTAYAYTPAAGQRVTKLLSLTLDSLDVTVVDPKQGRVLDDAGNLTNYAYGTLKGFELRPAQAAGLPIITYSAVAPTRTATTVPDDFERYLELVAKGALFRLFSSPELECGNQGAADRIELAWLDGIGDAKSDALTGFARSNPRTAPAYF